MVQQGRRPLGKGKVLEVQLLDMQALSQPRAVSETTRKLVDLLAREGDEQVGKELDDFLGTLGDSYIEGGRVKWDPPADLAPDFVAYFSRSVEALNQLIDSGTLRIDEDGDIVPA